MAWTIKESKDSQAGLATIKFNDARTKCKVEFEDGSFSKKFDVDDLPQYPNPKKLKQEDTYNVVISGDEETVWTIRPASTAPVVVKVVDFNRPEKDADPEPKTYKGKYGDFQMFGVVLEIQKGKFKGVKLNTSFKYAFFETDNGSVGIDGNPEKSDFVGKMANFLDLSGIADNDLEWEDNLLPTFLKVAKSKGNLFQVTLTKEKGYVDLLIAYDDDDEIDDFPEAAKVAFKEDMEEAEPVKEKVDTSLDDGEDW